MVWWEHERRWFKGCGREGCQHGLGLNAGVHGGWSEGRGEWCK